MRPDSEAALAAAIRAVRGPVTVRGGGTRGWPGEGGGTIIDTTALSGITLYEPAALTLVVRAGTPLAEVQAALAAEGQMLGFEPDARPGSTIGGVAAANASGPRRVLAGACRDAMIGVRLVDGHGEVVANGGRVMKNVTGYDLVKLMAGSRGTLGVLTEISFRTTPVPPATVVLRLAGLDATDAVPALTSALTGPFDVSAAGWLPGQGALLRIEGLAGSVAIRRAALAERLAPFGTVEDADPAVLAALSAPVPPPGQDLWRIVTRPSQAPAILGVLGTPVALDWGGALVWSALPAGTVPALPVFDGHARRVTGAAPALVPAAAESVAALNDDIRSRFDPRHLFRGAA